MGHSAQSQQEPNNMRRILLSSLLSTCVLGLPREYDYDYNNNNSSNAVDEVDYFEYEDQSSDNCSLAVPLYYPLRRSESFFKRIRGDIIWGANSKANYFEERIQRLTERDRDFRFWSSFRYLLEAELVYKDLIVSGSRYYLTYTDLFHSYISWGDFPDSDEGEEWRYGMVWWRRYGAQYDIARAEKGLDELVSSLPEDRNRNRNQN